MDLDLHIRDNVTGSLANYRQRVTQHAWLGGEHYYGGPESAVLVPSGREVQVAVQLYSTDVGSVFDARPVIEVTTATGSLRLRPSASRNSEEEWQVARILADGEILPLEAIIDF